MFRNLGILMGLLVLGGPFHGFGKDKGGAAGATTGRVAAADPASSNDPWQGFLARYLDTTSSDGVNRVRYAAVTPVDRRALEAHLKARQAVAVSTLPERARLAYWINLYNAGTVSVVLGAWPVKSILDINPSGKAEGKGKGPWKAKLLKVEGRSLSLDEIENAILRPEFRDPRIHFALNCASLGCPELAPAPYAADRLEAQLDRAARAFLASPHGVRARGEVLMLSSIFDWYRADFGKTPKEVREQLTKWAPIPVSTLLRDQALKLEYHYDWSINSGP